MEKTERRNLRTKKFSAAMTLFPFWQYGYPRRVIAVTTDQLVRFDREFLMLSSSSTTCSSRISFGEAIDLIIQLALHVETAGGHRLP